MKKYYITISCVFLFILSMDYAFSQNRSRNKKIPMLRQYTFSTFPVADSNSDSIRILSYLIVPNKVLKFVKKSGSFETAYQAKITLKKNKGEQVGRKSWSNTLKTNDYLESTSDKISTIHFYEFKVPINDYVITSELFDRDSNESGVINREIKLKKRSSDIFLFKPFLIDSFEGDWGLKTNEIPIITNVIGKKSIKPTIFLSGKIDTGKYKIDILINSSNKKELWNQSFEIYSDSNHFFQRITLPDNVINKGLRKKIYVTLQQGKTKKKESLIFGVTRDGFSKSIASFNEAILAMRYILVDDEYKNMRRSKAEEQEELFLSYWKERDPSPGTKENELQDEYFSRVAYANSSFKGSTDGWRTHMGEIYIKFGRPDDIEEYSDPFTRIYQQRWHYYRINKYFDFVDESGFGDYRLTSPFYGGNNW